MVPPPQKTHEECNAGEFDNKWTMTIFARKAKPARRSGSTR